MPGEHDFIARAARRAGVRGNLNFFRRLSRLEPDNEGLRRTVAELEQEWKALEQDQPREEK